MKFNALSLILLSTAAVLALSAYWQFNGAKMDFNNFNPQIPGANKGLSLSGLNLPGLAAPADPYKNFTSPGGELTLAYPSDFQGGENLFGQATSDELKSNKVWLFAYRVAIPDMQPSYIIVSESSATSTGAIAGQAQLAFSKQQCAASISNATSTNEAVLKILDAAYECPAAPSGFGQWRAQTAIVEKENLIYTIAAVTTAKNWPAFQIEAQTIFNSISIGNSAESATGTEEISK